ncbi:aminotransferase class I/II [Nitrosopumilus sp. b1]|uniref:pyridoxal phosphate-dependent aminotransferase n=1 Tax=Nitrosopumilus sp. b1 TaxID=2109907 RepID=UPI0015F4ACC3|nr:histidinol-phosphate transaminase [Nitrosopumilus sp. b1]KAF6242398.1 aminotransferase class I/II [Nitrosopumilus sp. b1]
MKPSNPYVIRHRPASHGGLYSVRGNSSKILDFSSNTNPLGSPPLVKKIIKEKLDTIGIYPDSDSLELRKNIHSYTKIPLEQIVVGNGATEIIYNFAHAFLSKKTPVLIPIPTFSEYENAVQLRGSCVSFFKTMNLNDDLEEFLQKIPKNGCVFVCNPNNPTGVLLPKKKMELIINRAKKNSSTVFVDECFIELVPESNETIIKLISKFDNLFVLRSLTKSFGLAGLRIGYGLGNKKIISILSNLKIPWNVSGIAQESAIASLKDKTFLKKSNQLIRQEYEFLRKNISNIDGFYCNESKTNFILIKTKVKSKILQKKLFKKNILIRDCSTFRGLDENHIRIAIKNRNENQLLVKQLKRISCTH